MADTVSARSILKQPSREPKPTLSDEQNAKVERDRQNLGIALFHANKIQSQKDYQNLILSNIERLLDYPASSSATPAESSEFTSLVTPFQPFDLESLVEERRIDGKCGYPLCPNVPRSASLGASAAWKLNAPGAGDYCSNDCLRKSLYVKTQLSEVPAWEREPGQQPQIVLLGADRSLSDRTSSIANNKQQSVESNSRELAMERGEQTGSFRPNQVMVDTIVEKAKPSSTFPAVKKTRDVSSYASIEGYVPSTTLKQTSAPSMKGNVNQLPQSTDVVEGGDGSADDVDMAWKLLYENLSQR